MTDMSFRFYSVLKNEDAIPYIGGNIIVAADGLGGSGSAVHFIDRDNHPDMRGDIMSSAFKDMVIVPEQSDLLDYINELIEPMTDGKDDTSALWASRIAIARCVYALTEGEFQKCDLSDGDTRTKLAGYIREGLKAAAEKFGLQKGRYDGQLLLPTTLALMRYAESEPEHEVTVEALWAGDSRCYALTEDGLKVLTVDDEDSSGAITNLFYADNNAELNYLRHTIKTPCVLIAVSDGVFDPFDPHSHLGAEHTLLTAIGENDSPESTAAALKKFYDSIHGDDATMAFVPVGFADFNELKAKLEKRTRIINELCREQARLNTELEVMGESEETASHYVTSRTRDRIEQIAALLVSEYECDSNDIALSTDLKNIIAAAEKAYDEKSEKERKKSRGQRLSELYNYVKSNPLLIDSILAPVKKINFNNNYNLHREYSCVWDKANKYKTAINNIENLNAQKIEVEKEREQLRNEVGRIINQSRDAFDRSGCKSNTNRDSRIAFMCVSHTWEYIDIGLQFDSGLPNLDRLPKENIPFTRKIREFIDNSRSITYEIKLNKGKAKSAEEDYRRSCEKVFGYLKNDPQTIPVLLTDNIVREYGFAEPDENAKEQFARDRRAAIITALTDKKETVVGCIVKALADNYDKTSVIDEKYNATGLKRFRTYCRLKASSDSDVKAFVEWLTTHEAGYTSPVK